METVLYIKKAVIKTDETLQKKIDIEELLIDNIEYFSDAEEAYKNGYIPLNFCVSVRSMYDNTVIIDERGMCYSKKLLTQPTPCRGYDLLFYCSKMALMKFFNFSNSFSEIMFNHSQFIPIGLYYSGVNNPVLYSHVIMTDIGMKELESHLKEGVKIIPISNIDTTKNRGVYTDTLISVKR